MRFERRAGLLLCVCLLCGDASRGAADGAWPTFKGDDARAGSGPGLGLPVSRAWSTDLMGSLYSSPAISGGLVVLGSSSKRVYAVELAGGARRWECPLPDRVWGSAPAIAGGLAYIGCVDGRVYAVDLADGSLRGSYRVRPATFFGSADILSPILVAGSRLIFGSDNHSIYGFDLAGGATWSVATGGALHDNGAAERDGLVVMASHDAKVYGLNLADGAVRWTYQGAKAFNTVPALDAQKAYLGCSDGKIDALSLADGTLQWSFATGKGVMSSPALGRGGALVVGSADGKVYCLDAERGTRRWAFQTGSYVLASPLITGRLVWIGSFDGSFYVLDLATGGLLWSMRMPGGVFAAAAEADGRVVVAGRRGTLVCLQATAPAAGR